MPGRGSFPYYPQVFGVEEESVSRKLQMKRNMRHVDLQSLRPFCGRSQPACSIAKRRQQREKMSDSIPPTPLPPFHPLSMISNDGTQKEGNMSVKSVCQPPETQDSMEKHEEQMQMGQKRDIQLIKGCSTWLVLREVKI